MKFLAIPPIQFWCNVKYMTIERIDIEKLGEVIAEYRDGKPWTSMYSSKDAITEVAKKLNEIIDLLSTQPSQD